VLASSPDVRYERVDLAPLGGVAEISESPLESIYRAILDYRQREIRQALTVLADERSFPVVTIARPARIGQDSWWRCSWAWPAWTERRSLEITP
jgi:hypothetical protein